MAVAELDKLRNVGILGQGGSGKTSLGEAMLFAAGATQRLGKVQDGTAVLDHEPEEIKHKVSISTAFHSLSWKKHPITLIDMPGYAAFFADSINCMRAASGAVFVVNPLVGLRVESERLWSRANEERISRLIFVTKMDHEPANVEERLAPISEGLEAKGVYLQMPIGAEASFKGIVDLVSMKAYLYEADSGKSSEAEIPADLKSAAESWRQKMVEDVCETDDELLEKFLDGKEPSSEELKKAIRQATRERKIFPVLFGSPLHQIGVAQLLDAIVDYLPAPAELGEVEGKNPGNGELITRPADPNAPFSAYVFKTVIDPFAGKLSIMRVMSGKIAPDMKKTGKVEAINSSGPAPAKASIDYFRELGLKAIPQSGALSIAVPGAVDGWLELHKKYATKELPRLTSDAIRIAREGFPISQEFAESIEELSSEFSWVDRCYRQPLGKVTPGKTLRQKGLGDVLEKIAQKGRDGFYAGEVADKICATVKAEGGILAVEDLQPTVCQWLEPLSSTYRDGLVFEQPPVSQGFMVLEMLNIAETWPFNDNSMSQADMLHYQVAAKKLAFEDRIRYLEDPRFGDPKISTLISKDYAAKRRDLVDDAMNRPSAKAANQSSDTTYLCAADRDGNAISFIQSVFAPFGSRIIAGDSGVVMGRSEITCFFLTQRWITQSAAMTPRPSTT